MDGRLLQARLAELPLFTWNYRAQNPAIRHLGPMAQDFRAAFSLGEDEKHISTVDADGVAVDGIGNATLGDVYFGRREEIFRQRKEQNQATLDRLSQANLAWARYPTRDGLGTEL